MPPSCLGLGWSWAQGAANANHAAFKLKVLTVGHYPTIES
ncbi:unnamed protein product [Camellia sinensis]